MRRVVRAAVDAGLTSKQDYGDPQVLDVPVSIFTVVTRTGRFETTVVLPRSVDGDTAAQSEARQRLVAFRKALNDLESWLGDDIRLVSEPSPVPHLVFSYKSSPSRYLPEETWPLDDLGVGGCQVLPAGRVRALSDAKLGRLWRSGENVYVVVLRPLLPDEKGCSDIKRLSAPT